MLIPDPEFSANPMVGDDLEVIDAIRELREAIRELVEVLNSRSYAAGLKERMENVGD